MHKLIRIVVIAENEDDALEQAKEITENLVEKTVIDYATFFGDNGVVGHNVKNWGYNRTAYKVTEKEGMELLLMGLIFDWERFLTNFEEAKKLINKTAKDLYSNPYEKYIFHSLNEPWFVFTENEGIDAFTLQRILSDENGEKIWIVPADVHT